ncbi:hypothetical protein CORC01_01299 [Colletotrichum orchidophilum]|uniref:Uncharacterized protein n=1 Tax=Colletotrichum orchidophilum TaxID=1209926 RepID=A0A1G4BQ45_9PEZI|nr:uncharacterized protein CORC01_01299 [Colletotrichum orchidophilum]OHF03580.1 hypothetical protein CORC01_01299 [Colletotrichum orchidophilum]
MRGGGRFSNGTCPRNRAAHDTDGTGTSNIRAELQLSFGGSVESVSHPSACSYGRTPISFFCGYGYYHIIDAENPSS